MGSNDLVVKFTVHELDLIILNYLNEMEDMSGDEDDSEDGPLDRFKFSSISDIVNIEQYMPELISRGIGGLPLEGIDQHYDNTSYNYATCDSDTLYFMIHIVGSAIMIALSDIHTKVSQDIVIGSSVDDYSIYKGVFNSNGLFVYLTNNANV